MARIATHTDTTPLAVEPRPDGKPVYVCRCGLTGKAPFCDGTHQMIRDEPDGGLYRYVQVNGRWERRAVAVDDAGDQLPH